MAYSPPHTAPFRLVRFCIAILIVMGIGSKSAPGASPGREPMTIESMLVRILPENKKNAQLIKLAEVLIHIRPGDKVTPSDIDAAVKRLTRANRFKTVSVEKKTRGEKTTLVFSLTCHQFIRDIIIDHAYPLFRRDVEKVMTLSVGAPYSEDELAQQEGLITRLYENEGYITPRASIDVRKDPRNHSVTITVSIDKGPYKRLSDLRFTGNTNISDFRLSLHMASYRSTFYIGPAGRFREADFTTDIDRLEQFYREKGFADVHITPILTREKDARHIHAEIRINEGARYQIEEISGNDEFFDFTLKKDMVFFQKGNKYGLGVRRSVQKMKTRYHEKGYPDTRIEVKEKETLDEKGPTKHLRYIIHEGPEIVVDQVMVTGNQFFSEKKIRKQILTAPPGIFSSGVFLLETLEADIMAIRALYLGQGFQDVSIQHQIAPLAGENRVVIHLTIEEGKRTLIQSVQIKGVGIPEEKALLKEIGLKPKAPFVRRQVTRDENQLSAIIAEQGFPYVQVKGEVTLDKDHENAHIVYHVTRGEPVIMGDVFLGGNFRTKTKVIEDELEMDYNEPFSLKKMVLAQKSIRDMNIFQSVRFKTMGIDEHADTVHLFVDVVEAPSYHVDGGTGYDTRRGVYFMGRLEDSNLWGLNQKAWTSYEPSEIGYRGEIGLADPRFLGTRVDQSLILFAERKQEFNKDFEDRTKGATLGFTRKMATHFIAGLNFTLKRSEQIYDDVSKYDGDDTLLTSRTTFITTPALTYDDRDSFIRPKSGFFNTLSVDISRGLSYAIDHFYTIGLDIRYFYSPIRRFTLACHFRGGYIHPYGGNTDIPNSERLFLGGTTSVRGFRENRLEFDENGDAIGGKTSLCASLEARYDLGYNLELALFIDSGKLMDLPDDLPDGDVRHAAGGGFRFLTPIGPIGLLYGAKLDPRDNEADGEFHFSIGYTF